MENIEIEQGGHWCAVGIALDVSGTRVGRGPSLSLFGAFGDGAPLTRRFYG